MEDKKAVVAPQKETFHKIRITLTSRDVKALEKVCANFIKESNNKKLPRVKGPIRLPTRTLLVVTRKSPCGNGTASWDKWEMRVHKRVIDLVATPKQVKDVTSVRLLPNVDIDVTVSSA